MLSTRRLFRKVAYTLQHASLQTQGRRTKSSVGKATQNATTLTAKHLKDSGLWQPGRWTKKGSKRPKGDKYRVNIVSEKLCDDVLTYAKPSLLRHVGCDIVDIYPGAGVWSRKLHDLLQPRSHILLEPDTAVYGPLLQPLLNKKGTSLIAKSGIVWRDLSRVLHPTHLPHQQEQPPRSKHGKPPQPNDTLLVTANLSFQPKRKFSTFQSITQLVLYQFMSSVRTSSLFNKYGLVRFLVWVEDSEKDTLLPRSCQRRRRMAVEGELATESIVEMAGADEKSRFLRDQGLDMASCRLALDRMAAAGLEMPEGRQPAHLKEFLQAKETGVLAEPAVFSRPWKEEWQQLEAQWEAGRIETGTDTYRRLLHLRYRHTQETRATDTFHALLGEMQDLAGSEELRGHQESEWNGRVEALSDLAKGKFLLQRDNQHIVRQQPPVLSWDRRRCEPLVVDKDEFFPNTACALLDIQPKAMHPMMCMMGPGSNQAGSIFEIILREMMGMGGDPISKSIESIWPGAAKGVLPNCPSLRDTSKGGRPMGGYGELSARSLNDTQWCEILEAWMKWPFHPTLSQLVARGSSDMDAENEDDPGVIQ